MKLHGLIIFSALLSACASTPQPIEENAYPGVVVVEVFNKSGGLVALGSGVVIGEGSVITNCHVVDEGHLLQLRQRRKYYPAKLEYADPRRDLCQLTSPGLPLPVIEIVNLEQLKVGQPVYTVTAPAGFAREISTGSILALQSHDGTPVIKTDAEVAPGSSGGGLFDKEGRLLGITTFIMFSGDEKYTYAIPAELIKELPERAQTESILDPVPIKFRPH